MLRNFRSKVTTARESLFSPSRRRRLAGSKPGGGNRLQFETLESRLVLSAGSLEISEFMADNDNGLRDGDNDAEDWIEIHNRSADPINLLNWSLTDDADELTRWQFPDRTLAGGESLVVFASGKYPNGPAGQLHTNFKLGKGGEYLALVGPDGTTIESAYTPEFPEQYSDISYGWSSDFTEQGYFIVPTPDAPNSTDLVPDPTVQVIVTEIMYHPASENVLDEYIELTNRGFLPVELEGFQLTDGVEFTFGAGTLDPGEYLVVAADLAAFQANYPAVTNVVGGWEGQLSNAGETIELVDAAGQRVDRVTYADQGDWTFREVGVLDHEHYGWSWSDLHDGGGRSLELINTALSNNYGQNWAASLADGGSPGIANGVSASDVAPMILDVAHSPAIPSSTDSVTVTARLRDELATGLGASVYYRNDGDPAFLNTPMYDDGAHGDGAAGDGFFGAILPPASNGTVVEFYVQSTDGTIHTRIWPAPVEPSGEQLANLLYQVDNAFVATADWTPGSLPIYRLIMTDTERLELADIGDDGNAFFGEARSNAQMNGTFISVDGTDTKIRYNVGIRNRGNRSRVGTPNNYRLNFRTDDAWKDVTALNINADTPDDQVLGSALFRMADLAAPQATSVEVRVNGQELSNRYAAVEVYDSDWAGHHFPDDPAGNVYRLRYHQPQSGSRTVADLDYKGVAPYDNPDDYRENYGKQTNAAEDDWTDLIELIDKLNNPDITDAQFVAEVSTIIDLRQWMRYMATDFLAGNAEGGLLSGSGDDAAMYSGIEDRRFRLLPHDLDTLFDNRTTDIFGFEDVNGLYRLMNHPDVIQIYYAEYLDLIATVFAPENFDPLVDQVLGDLDSVSQSTINSIKQFNVTRSALALSQIPYEFTITSDLPVANGYPRAMASTTSLYGTANAAETNSVLVDGQVADWSKVDGTWLLGDGSGNFVSDRLVRSGDDVTYYVPREGEDPLAWTATNFNDSSWSNSTITGASGVLITEISAGDTRFVEVENVGRDAISTNGWRVLLNDPSFDADPSIAVNAVGTATWQLPDSIGAGDVLSWTDNAIPWVNIGDNGWAMVIDGGGQVMDFVAWGYSDADIAAMDIGFGGFASITVGNQWSGVGAEVGSTVGGPFVSFNDKIRGPATDPNATSYGVYNPASGPLQDITSGMPTGVTLTTSAVGGNLDRDSQWPVEGTDAHNVFVLDGYVDFTAGSNTSYELLGNDEYEHTFTGLDTGDTETYDFTGTAIRGGGSNYAIRWTLVTLVGADAATPAHSAGAVVVNESGTEVAIPTGQNHTANQGLVAAWTDIDPGPDGQFTVKSTQYTGEISQDPVVLANGTKGYALTAVRLAGVAPLKAFSVLKRTAGSDGNAAGDFVRIDTATPGSHNTEMTVPFGQVTSNTTGVGFSDDQGPFEAVIRTDVTAAMLGEDMLGVSPSLWTRIEFLAGETSQYDTLMLRMKYDDGFVAYLNGTEVARRNADNEPAHDVAASAERSNSQAVMFENIDISEHLDALQLGYNVLAIHGLNVTASDTDFLLDAELVASGGEVTDGLTLRPGINRVFVQTFDGPNGTGNELDGDYIDLWYDAVVIPDGAELNMIVRDSYLPGTPLLVRVEMLDEAGNIDRSLWNGTATLSVDQGGVILSTSTITLYNGLGSTLVTPTGSGDFTLGVHLGGLSLSKTLTSLEGEPVTEVSGELPGIDTILSGIVHVTGDLLVPAGHTLTLEPGTLMLIDGTDPGPNGIDIDVEGTILSLGTALSPVTFTAFDSTQAWGEIHHNGADPSLYQYTNIHRAGNSPRGGHTGTGPAVRPSGSEIVFDHVTISDIDGKIMQSTSGSDLTFRNSHLARAVMGPEIANTALLFENNWITEMWGENDNDGLYIHDQQAGQDITLRGGVHAGFDDDALDTLSSTVTVEDYIFRDAADKGISVLNGSVSLSRVMSIDNDIGISAKGSGSNRLDVTIDHATIVGNRLGIEDNDKYGVPDVVVDYFISNSIIWGNGDAIQTDYPQIADHIQIDHTNLSEPWPGEGNLNKYPQFVAPGSFDFRLLPTSPSRNAGDPTLPLDADGSRADQGFFAATVQGNPAPKIIPGGTITEDTILTPDAGPYSVTGDVTVGIGATLSILPGTVVYFAAGTRLNVNGRLLAEGTDSQRITLSQYPATNDTWDGIHFASAEDNRMAYVDMADSSGDAQSIDTDNSRLLIDNMTWTGTDKTILRITDSSLIVRNSIFPDTVVHTVSGRRLLAADPYLLFEGNTFGIVGGDKQDVVDFTTSGPTPPIRFLNNTFLGGGDDGLDLDGTNAYIEGNVFMNFHKTFDPEETGEYGESHAITTGDDAGYSSQYTIIRNTFIDVDHAVLVKDRSFVTFENNTVVRASVAAINFHEPLRTVPVDPGLGAYLDGNIFFETPTLLANVLVDDPTWGSTDVTVDRSVVPTDALALGVDNTDADPMLTNPSDPDPANLDFTLLDGSPAIGTGPNGLDMGSIVAHGASITGEPESPTALTDATLSIAGPGITHYKYRVNTDPWSADFTIDTPLVLTDLDAGDYSGYSDLTVYVLGKDVSGRWEGDPEATASATWEITAGKSSAPKAEPAPAETAPAETAPAETGGTTKNASVKAAGNQTIPDGPIVADITLTAEAGPYYVTGDAVVRAGVTMTIEPGTTVFFEDGASLTIRGRLVAEGTQYELIRFTRTPGGTNWGGIQFNGTMQDNRITYAVLEYATTSNGMVGLDNSNLLIDHVTFDHAERRRIRTIRSSLIVRNSTFTEMFPGATTPPLTNNGSEHLWGRYIPAGGHFIIENNVFGAVKGHNDALDFDAGLRPQPVMQILGNLFLGSGDDALDLEGDAHIEGNVFMHVRKDQWNYDPGESNTISAGDGHEFVVTRNVFYDVEHAALVKEDAFMTFVNNTVVNASVSALYFDLAGQTSGPGIGAYVDGNIFVDTPIVFSEVLEETELIVNRSILPAEYHDLGVGNLETGGYLIDPAGGDFSLAPNSPDGGLGLGAMVPAGVSISGEPAADTAATDATLTVGFPGVPHATVYSHYKYRLDGGDFSEEPISVEVPIRLSGLADGPHTVDVIGLNSAGVWQDEAEATASKTWTVNTALSRVRINEVLASNVEAFEHQGTYPDLIELINDGGQPVDLAGMSLSDDIDDPTKFVFPANTVLQPGELLVLFADDSNKTTGLHLGFALESDGETLTLFDTPANESAELDSITFGLQLDDLSIGRVGHDGEWTLTQPTFGAENITQGTGTPATLSINEWLADGSMLFVDDFIELYNPDPAPVALGGLFLTDNPYTQPHEHEIAALSFIAGGGYAVFTADGDTDAGAEHVSFKLATDQEMLGLFDGTLGEIDKLIYYPQTTDVSQGRTPDGSDVIAFFPLPSPGAPNPGTGSFQAASIAIDGSWTYNQSGADLGTQWREPEYVEDALAGWNPEAPALLYDEISPLPGPKNTELEVETGKITFYFRTHFQLDGDPADVTELNIGTIIDDGAVIYINGHEVRRIGFGANVDVDYLTRASGIQNATLVGPSPIATEDLQYLRRGDNVIAVEVHQSGPNSSDIVFGLTLEATIPVQGGAIFARAPKLIDGLRVSELMYHPAGDEELEFVELINVSAEPLDITGVRLSGAVDGTLPNIVLAPGERIAMVRDLDRFYLYDVAGVNIGGQYSGSLSNGGEDFVLQLPAPLDGAIQRFEYDNDWYPTTDGGGFSLVIVDPYGELTDWDLATSWQPGTVPGGSPGRDDNAPTPIAGVVIHEVLSHTDLPATDTIELYNTSDAPVDVGGWFLSDSARNRRKFRIPTNDQAATTIAPGGYLVFDETDFNPFGGLDPEGHPNDFALNGADGDEVWLTRGDAAGNPAATVDYVTFGAARNGESFGRQFDDTGRLHFYPTPYPTLSSENGRPRVGPVIISEIHYNPGNVAGDDDLEFVELFNSTSATVNLAHWRLRGGIDFNFSADMEIAPRATLLILPFDPMDGANAPQLSAFRSAYGIDASVAMVGGYSPDKLSNGGERIRLQRPDTPAASDPDDFPQLLEDEVLYDDVAPWPTAADGGGSSLNRIGEDGWGHDAGSWTAGTPSPGTFESDAVEVVGRYVFYNNSRFDGNDEAANALDDAAIATDKTALLPMQTAGFANYTSYDKGLNGILIDIANLEETIGLDAAANFVFKVGNYNDADSWTTAPAPQSITVRTGLGGGTFDRVTIRFADGAIQGKWLQVTVLDTVATGLDSPDVFYFGNAIGEAGDQTRNAIVNATDEIVARNFQRSPFDPATVDDRYDYNRDGLVNGSDQIIARNHQTNPLTMLRRITAPAAAKPVKGASQDPIVLPAKFDWLYEYEQMNAKDRSRKTAGAVDIAIDQLLADYES